MKIAETYVSLRMSELKGIGLTIFEPALFSAYSAGTKVGTFQVDLMSVEGTLDWMHWERLSVIYTDLESKHKIVQWVDIEWVECKLGGARNWFLCPDCRRRCTVLYVADGLRCRKCLGLSFESQSLHPIPRRVRQIGKRRKKVGGSGDIMSDFPPKPKGMRWATYDRLIKRDSRELCQHFDEAGASLDAMMAGRTGKTSLDPTDDLINSNERNLEAIRAARNDQDLHRDLAQASQPSPAPVKTPK